MKYNKENPLRVMTLASGYDSQCLALERLKKNFPEFDYELVAWAEFDPETPNTPIEKQPAVVAHNALFPQYSDRNYGDITKIDWEKVPDFDLLTASTPCFVAGTLVLTSKGYKPIEEVKVGDYVLTHTNQYHKVLKTGRKIYEGELYDIKGMSFELIQCTDEHPFYVRSHYRKGHKGVRTFREPKWVKAKDLTNDYYMGYAIDQSSVIPKWNYLQNKVEVSKKAVRVAEQMENGDFWYLMGRFVGDGWIRQDVHHNSVIIACSERNEEQLLRTIESVGYNYCISKERTCSRVTINNKELSEFCKRYGRGAENKVIDSDTLHLPVDLLKTFLMGYIDSDGCYLEKEKSYQITTVSRQLAITFGQCVAKVFHKAYKVYKCHMPPKTIIEGRVVNQKDFYIGRFKNVQSKQDHAFYEDGVIWFPLNKIEHSRKHVMVYNLEVEEDNSYTANGAIVHNCQSVSAAGLQHGFAKGSGTRSSIIWNVHDCVRVKKPKYIFMENVSAILSGKFLPLLLLWCDEVERMGYVNFMPPSFDMPWSHSTTKDGCINSKNYGVPQNRERWFMVSILRTPDEPEPRYHFPKPFKLETCLGDVLQEDVDESFFLRNEMLARFCEKSIENDTP